MTAGAEIIDLEEAAAAQRQRDEPPPAPPPDPDALAPPGGPIPLGHDRGVYYYLSRASGQIVALGWGQHGKAGLLALASLPHFWERSRFMGRKAVAWDEAGDWLMRTCERVGVFDPGRIRGRGAWWDEGRAIVHLGDKLVVDGDMLAVGDLETKFIYEQAAPIAEALADPMRATDAAALMEICRGLRWERGAHAYLLAGWIVLAPICGALGWRPSIWITGPAGSGKSYVLDRIIRAALGYIAVLVQSKTSEAGIRQTLGGDARPVIFDEAEQEDMQARLRMQGVLDLVRQAASEGGAEIIKGSQNQSGPKRYRVRSMFCFCSINVGIEQYADETRITVLPLTGIDPKDDEQRAMAEGHFQELDRRVAETLTPDFASRLLARSVSLMPTIREAARVFAAAVAAHLGNRRVGDQLGALLAGAWSLHKSKPPSYDEALAWVRAREWHGSTAIDADPDEIRLLDFLKQQTVRIVADNRPSERLLGELLEAATAPPPPPDAEGRSSPGGAHGMGQAVALEHLLRLGIRHEKPLIHAMTAPDKIRAEAGAIGEGFWIADSHYALKQLLRNTPWASQWSRTLARLRGACRSGVKTIRFGAHSSLKAVFLPLETVTPKEEEQQ